MSDFSDPTHWAVNEFADADLGDLRRTQRLVQLARALAQNPGARLPEACGSGAMAKAAYRFFDHDDMEPPERVQSHLEAKTSPATCLMAASHRLPWCWPCKIRLRPTGAACEPPRVWDRWVVVPVKGGSFIAPWRSCPIRSLWACWCSRSGRSTRKPPAWQALDGAIHRVSTPPDESPLLGEAVRWITQLGGFVSRRRGDQPGTEVLWRGFQHLGDLTTRYRMMRPHASSLQPP